MASDTLTYRSLRTTPVRVPLAEPVRTASGQVTHAPLVLIDLLAEEGVEGRAYLFAYTPLVLKPLALLVDELAGALQGQPLAPHAVERLFESRLRLLGTSGLMTMALAGIDMAIWDLLARAAGWPLGRLVGGHTGPVPAYLSLGMDGRARAVAAAERCVDEGYGVLKLKIGYPTLAEDLEVVRAVQSTLGGRAALAVDYNQSLTVPEALRRGRALDDFDLAWIEEPTRHDDDSGHARVARDLRTPLMLGENWSGTEAMSRSLAAGACDLVMPDLMKIGGVSGWLRAAALASAARLPMGSHLFPEMTAHLMTATPTAHRLEMLDLAGPVLQSPLRVERGLAWPSAGPGSGLDWDVSAVERYRVA